MADFFAMGGYANYVWIAYAVFFGVLGFDALAPLWQRRRALRELRGRLKRDSTRRSAPPQSASPQSAPHESAASEGA